jgi:hypothetical protein
MPKRWRIALPCIGLSLFIALTHGSLRMNREIQKRSPSQYFWWTSIRLDSDPLNRHPKSTTTPCKNGEENCVNWELPPIVWVDPSWAAKFLMLSALPAFVVGTAAVRGLASLGVSEVWSFAIVMPLLILAWFYFVGWLIDRWVHKRSQRRAQTPV